MKRRPKITRRVFRPANTARNRGHLSDRLPRPAVGRSRGFAGFRAEADLVARRVWSRKLLDQIIHAALDLLDVDLDNIEAVL